MYGSTGVSNEVLDWFLIYLYVFFRLIIFSRVHLNSTSDIVFKCNLNTDLFYELIYIVISGLQGSLYVLIRFIFWSSRFNKFFLISVSQHARHFRMLAFDLLSMIQITSPQIVYILWVLCLGWPHFNHGSALLCLLHIIFDNVPSRWTRVII